MIEYIYSTRRLLDLLGYGEWQPQDPKDIADPDPVDAALSNWENDLYDQEFYERGTWPCSPELLSALRAALVDQRGNYAGERLAYTLIRCGCREPETIAGLNQWDALLFRWSDAGLTAQMILEKFRQAGATGAAGEDELRQLQEWLWDPVPVLASGSADYAGTILLKGRVFIGDLYHNGGWPGYAELFEKMATRCVPPLVLSGVSQENLDPRMIDVTEMVKAEMGDRLPPELHHMPIYRPVDAVWKISFTFDSKPEAIYVPGDTTWLDDAGLAKEFNKMLTRLGRNERVIRFGQSRQHSGGFVGRYIVAEARPFLRVCEELVVPLDQGFLEATAEG